MGSIYSKLLECAQIADKYAMEIDFEPVNRYEVDHHNSIESMYEFINSIGAGNIRLLVDTFHMNIEEPCIEKSVIEAGELLGHVHLADSNRKIPSKGHFDFGKLFKTLKEQNYTECLTIEAMTDSNESEIENTMKFLKSTPFFWRNDEIN